MNKAIKKDNKIVAKEDSSTSLKERNAKNVNNIKKKVTSKQVKESETDEVLPKAIEKEITAKNVEVKIQSKAKETVKKTTTKKTPATKNSAKQEIDLKTQSNESK